MSEPLATGPILRVEHLTRRFGRLTALDDVSFSVHAGEVLGLIGPNGSGKTTLFECLGGVLPADAGRVVSGAGEMLTAGDRKAMLFYLPDTIAPWPGQSVRWALDFFLGYFDGRTGLRDEVVMRLRLTPLLSSRLGDLSKGQRKRVLLALGLLAPQPILLADEPFDGLDLRQTREVAATLRAFAASGRTLFLSIHQIGDAARVCDRFVLLSEGSVKGEGTLADLTTLAATRYPGPTGDLEEVFLALT